MGKWQFRGINPRTWVIAMLVSFLCVHISYSIHPGQSSPASAIAPPMRHANGKFSPGTFYLTRNVTVPDNQTYTISNENLVLESLNQLQLGFTVFGNLRIRDSRISMDQAAYSRLANFSIFMEPGSTLNITNSNMAFPGRLHFDHSNVSISDSNITSSSTIAGNPSDNALTMNATGSDMSISNSTLKGLYRQHGQKEYLDGMKYLDATPYSISNLTLPMAFAGGINERSIINAASFNVSYTSKYNENSSYLEVYHNGSMIADHLLPYNRSESGKTITFKVNFTGRGKNLSWMSNSSNFHLVSVINSGKPITILNISEQLDSNDTVSLYGMGLYSYGITNSRVMAYNSTLGVNDNSTYLPNGERNPNRLSMSLRNTSLVMEDSSSSSQGNYADPFFNAADSSIFFARSVQAEAFSHGIRVQNLTYAVSHKWPSGRLSSTYLNALESTGTIWTMDSGRSVVYETLNKAGIFNYTDSFTISSGTDSSHFSISPYPSLSQGSINVPFVADSIPFAHFHISGAKVSTNGPGSFTLKWAGNLSNIPAMTVHWALNNSTAVVTDGISSLPNPGKNGSYMVSMRSNSPIPAGNYTLHVDATTSSEHAFSNGGKYMYNTTVAPVHPESYPVTIAAHGQKAGSVWGVSVGNHTYYTTTGAISFNITGNTTADVISPGGFFPSHAVLKISKTEETYSVSFSRLEYILTFRNANITTGQKWELLISGMKLYSTNSTIQVHLVPGSYNYEVIDPHGFQVSHPDGIVDVANGSKAVSVNSVKVISWPRALENSLSLPEYYLPIFMAAIIVIALLGWNASHTWYICSNCGSTRKRKRDACPYCGKK